MKSAEIPTIGRLTGPLIGLLLLGLVVTSAAQEPDDRKEGTPVVESIPEISDEDFRRLHDEVKPRGNESPWRRIKWYTDITEARRRAIAEDKPIVVFTAADGSPLGRT